MTDAFLPVVTGVAAGIKIFVCFGAILLLYRAKVGLGISILSMGVVLSLWSGAGPRIVSWQLSHIFSAETIFLLLVVAILLFFSTVLNESGRAKETLNGLRVHVDNTSFLLGASPALIGLLPMPGGALFSAPLVQCLDERDGLSPSLKASINYWFRHVWEYWWPLYPGVVLAVKYSHLALAEFIVIQLPFTLMAIAAGYFFLLRRSNAHRLDIANADAGSAGRLHAALIPIGSIILCSVAGSFVLPAMVGMSKSLASLVSLFCGVVVALVIAALDEPHAIRSGLSLFSTPKVYTMMLLVLGIGVFSNALTCPIDARGTTLVSQLHNELIAVGVPMLLVTIMLPFISGLVTGIAIGFVGTTFPLIFALIDLAGTSFFTTASVTVLAFGFGYAGMLLSPLHVCFIVSNEYFNAHLFRSYRYILGPILLLMLWTLCLAGVYRIIG